MQIANLRDFDSTEIRRRKIPTYDDNNVYRYLLNNINIYLKNTIIIYLQIFILLYISTKQYKTI